MKLLTHLFISVIAIVITAYLLPGATVTPFGAVVLAVVLGVINIFIKPLVKIITLPLTILTLGLFSLVINALFIILASNFIEGFSVSGFWTAFWFSIILSLVNALFNRFQDSE